MGDIIVRSSQTGLAINNGPSVLGERQARIPVGGKIRAGIKVLTSNAKKHPDAQAIYDAGVKVGKKWDVIEKELRDRCKFDRSPLTPKNVPWFTVNRSDFAAPQTADQIMAMYGEVVDGVPRLMSFPVIFPTDNWQANLPHGLKTYTRNELVYWSEYDADGSRRCFTKAPVQVDQRSKRVHRHFGGRPTIPRPENNGICDPDKCPEFQARKCNLTGSTLFYIPGIPGSGAIELPTTSFYAMQQARQKMEMVAYLRGGRISGTVDGKPIFYITKKMQEVPMIDPETGATKRVQQYIVTLEADIDMGRVFQSAELQRLHAGELGATAAAALEMHTPDDDDGVITSEVVEDAGEDDLRDQIKTLRSRVHALMDRAGIEIIAFKEWAASKHGDSWSANLEPLKAIDEELAEAFETDIEDWKKDNDLDWPF